MFIRGLHLSNPGSRKRTVFSHVKNWSWIQRNLRVVFKNSSGRTGAGRRAAFSKCGITHRRYYIKLNLTMEASYSATVLLTFINTARGTATLGVFAAAPNLVYATYSNIWMVMWHYTSIFPQQRIIETTLRAGRAWPRQIKDLELMNEGCALILLKKKRIAVTAGTSIVVAAKWLSFGWSLVILPSGKFIFAEFSSPILLGKTNNIGFKFFRWGTAGSSRYRGFAPHVRGIAKNPNDHPHGGRAKSIRLPRTPWGLNAKQPRKPKLMKKLKVLSKRIANSLFSNSSIKNEDVENTVDSEELIDFEKKNSSDDEDFLIQPLNLNVQNKTQETMTLVKTLSKSQNFFNNLIMPLNKEDTWFDKEDDELNVKITDKLVDISLIDFYNNEKIIATDEENSAEENSAEE